MDHDKLIDDLRVACTGNQYNIMGYAALAIETLRADLARVTAERDAAVECIETVYTKILIKCKIDAVRAIEKWKKQKGD